MICSADISSTLQNVSTTCEVFHYCKVFIELYFILEEELGFHLQKRQSQRVPPPIVTDLDFADDLALITEEIEHAQEVHCNAKKTEIQAFNHDTPITQGMEQY